MTQQYDIIINGAGMVGAVAALMLAEQGFTVALIESQCQTLYSPKEDRQLKVSAISKHNLGLFERLGLSAHWHNNRIGYYKQMCVWDNHSTGETDFSAEGNQVLGAMIENNQIIAVAQQLASEHNQIDVYFKTAITAFEDAERKVHLNLNKQSSENPIKLSSYLLIGADGARSMVRTELGIKTQQKSYQQQGLVCYLHIENAPAETALQSFNSGGPVGLLPMNEGLFSMVWSLPDDQVEHWLKAEERQFINALKVHINRDFGAIELRSDRQAFPLQKTVAKAFYQGRVAVMGDAAHTIHPLAGQGVNLGFGDAECLVEKLSQINIKDADEMGRALKKYQRVRMAEVHKTAETMHALHHLFTNQSAPVKMLRAFGMNRVNQIKPLKQWLLRQAGS